MPIEMIRCKKEKIKLADDILLLTVVATKDVCDIFIVSAKDRFEYKAPLNTFKLFMRKQIPTTIY